jgi:hypothetical protein
VSTVGLIVNPAAGRDIRRLVGGASVSDDYGKRRTAGCVLEGLSLSGECEVLCMPTRSGLASAAIEDPPEGVSASLLELPTTNTAADTRRAAEVFGTEADCVVTIGGDGTVRDVARVVGDVPILAISTGTNNVVPTPIEGTVAGAAAGYVASGAMSVREATTRHGTVEARVERDGEEERIGGMATMGVLDREFLGTRAILDAGEFRVGVVSRASRGEIGLSGIAGALTTYRADDPGGVGMCFDPDASEQVRAITAPGVVSEVGIATWGRFDPGESLVVEVERGVLTADGERVRELTDATVRFTPRDEGPLLIDPGSVFDTLNNGNV